MVSAYGKIIKTVEMVEWSSKDQPQATTNGTHPVYEQEDIAIPGDLFALPMSQILRRRIREGKALLEKSPFLPHKEPVLGYFSSLFNQQSEKHENIETPLAESDRLSVFQ